MQVDLTENEINAIGWLLTIAWKNGGVTDAARGKTLIGLQDKLAEATKEREEPCEKQPSS